jgi:hypothetical protein
MKNLSMVFLVGYLGILLGIFIQAVGQEYKAGIYTWVLPFQGIIVLGVTAILAYCAGKESIPQD